ncbi:Golgin subfamily B member 1 [Microtus ochrogaster]|uniref:Golgin subfamily B member 1 n=1 Tax=Microtus ochrogaster TaxID=79684 RepID=A0A8J6KUN2_MICOH|nr:Golgin subfamily B member 1 [Microtus ochrogaster]
MDRQQQTEKGIRNKKRWSSMQQMVREKDTRFETQVRLHEDEPLPLVTQADVETKMQQKLRVTQKKLEDQEEALLGRAQAVDLLQQKLTLAEQRNQMKAQLKEMEAEKEELELKFSSTTNVITEEETQALAGKSQEQDTQSVSVKLEDSDCLLSANSAKPGTSETLGSHDDINDHLQQLCQLKGRVAELEMEKQSDRELTQTLENEKNAFLSQISAKDGELKLPEEEVTKINMLNQQIQEELSPSYQAEMAEEEKDYLEERLMNQLAEFNGSIGNYYKDVTDAQIKNERLESEVQNLKKCMSDLEEEKRQLIKEKTKDDHDSVIEEDKKRERKFGDAIQTKEEEIKEESCMVLKDQLQQMTTRAEELKISIAKCQMSDEVNVKEQKVISLLFGKEEAIQPAVAKLHQQYNKEIKKLENPLSQKEEENVALEEENKKAVEKTSQLILSEVQQQLCSMNQEVSELKKLLKEEREQRLAIENAPSFGFKAIPACYTPLKGQTGDIEK